MNEIKPGWQTSEFQAMTVITVGGFLLSKLGLGQECQTEVLAQVGPYILGGLASFGYSISRGITKLRGK